MISKIIRLLPILFICYCLPVLADEPAYVVFYNSGKAAKIVLGKAIILKKGDQLYKTDQITIPAQTQLALVCASYSVIQLKTKMNKQVNDLPSCAQQSTSASSAYFKYIWNSFAHKHVSPDKDPRAYMKTYGAVSRGNNFAKLYVDTINYYAGTLNIAWKQGRIAEVAIYNAAEDGDLLLKTKAAKYAKLDSIALKLKKPGKYYWDLVGEQSANKKVLKIYAKDAYLLAINKILASAIVTSAAETAYLKGFMLEEKFFLAEAAKYYKLAVQLDPKNETYAVSYAKFVP
jgi:hypothetical protein